MSKYTYITAVTSNEYVKGAICLQESLKLVKSQYPLLVLVTEDLKDCENLSYLDNYKFISHYIFDKDCGPNAMRYLNTVNKFHIFNEIEYKKLCWIDSDVIVYNNLDFLFEKYENVDFVFKLYPNKLAHYFSIEGTIFLIKPLGQKYLNDNLEYWLKEYATDEEILNFEIFPKLLSSAVLMERSDYRYKYLHGVGQYKYFVIFQSGKDIIELFKQKPLKEIIQVISKWREIVYDGIPDYT